MKLVYLTEKFYARFQNCPEILEKSTRPYACLEVEIDGLTFAIPFRHHIKHKYAFHTVGDAGLDYSKAVVISESDYIREFTGVIDTRELNALKGRDAVILNGMRKYYQLFLKSKKYPDNPHYNSIRRCSSLQYFL